MCELDTLLATEQRAHEAIHVERKGMSCDPQDSIPTVAKNSSNALSSADFSLSCQDTAVKPMMVATIMVAATLQLHPFMIVESFYDKRINYSQ